MFCYNCGKEIEKKMLFCPYCGNQTINLIDSNCEKNDNMNIESDYVSQNKNESNDFNSIIINEKNSGFESNFSTKATNLTKSNNQHDRVYSLKPKIIDMQPYNSFESVGQFLFNYRQIFLAGFAVVMILLYFCNFMDVQMFGVSIGRFNGFQSIGKLFTAGKELISGEITITQDIQGLLIAVYAIYFVMMIDLVVNLIKNIVSFFKKENDNVENCSQWIILFIFSLALLIIFYVLVSKMQLQENLTEVIHFSSGVWALLGVSLVGAIYALVCNFCKLNKKVKKTRAEISSERSLLITKFIIIGLLLALVLSIILLFRHS